ncbi:uncharacterized protein DNG_03283 [Cephalotrichum gorgonifer]|uniref:Uncharacterized protein n=1 Tax=Cephalotrichum gorgonifer TaxID=2041049 RepID=A0AAE8STF1_9PEZI|nr:uncharacterized protein DNG_03283 [Cephalotrichum gorgonifer]
MLNTSSLAPPKPGRSRFSKVLPDLPPSEPFEPFGAMSDSFAPAPVPVPVSAPATVSTIPNTRAALPNPYSLSIPKSAGLPPQAAPAETYLHSPLPPLPPQRQQQQQQPLSVPLISSPLQKAAPTPPPPMSIPRRPVAKPAAAPKPTPQPEPEPASPSGSLSSLLSAYSRSSGESVIRSSDGGGDRDGAANRPSEPAFSPAHNRTASELKNAYALPLRSASLAPKGGQGLIDGGRDVNGLIPPPPPAKDIPSGRENQHEGGGSADSVSGPGPGPAPAAHQEPGMRSRSSSQTTSDLWVRRTAKSNQTHDVPELRLEISSGNHDESRALPKPSYTAVSTAQNSPARPLQPEYSAYNPLADARKQSPLPPIPLQPTKTSPQSAGDTMGQRSSKLNDKIHALRGDGNGHPARSSSRKDASLPSPPSQKLTPASGRPDESSEGVSPLSVETSQDENRGQQQQQAQPQLHHQDMQQQQQQQHHDHNQQQQQQQSAVPSRKPVGSNNLHAARSLPDMKSPVPQTSSERPPPISPEYVSPQESSLPREQPPAEHKFPPRTSSTRGPAPIVQKAQQLPEGVRSRANSNAVYDSRPPSVDRRVERVASNPNFADYAAPPSANRPRKADDTVYREVNQDELPPPDPRAMYFPQQTSHPPAAGTVFKAPSLTGAHHACFQQHAKMIMARNKFYPLSCMACEVEDNELRWQCAWCRLRVCGVCMRLLQTYERDLGKVVGHLKSQPQRVSDAPSATGSSGTLEAVEEALEPGHGRAQNQSQGQGQSQSQGQ